MSSESLPPDNDPTLRVPPDALRGNDPAALLQDAMQPRSAPPVQGWEPPTPESLAGFFPGYEIETMIGKGGMGAVYKARQTSLKRNVAIKLLPPHFAADAEFRQRFQREAESLAALQHPNIVAIYDFGTAGQHLYFVMEYVDGVDLSRLMHSKEVPYGEALHVMQQVCDALQFAHDEGIIHRDIKPSNILVDRRGRVKVADFGLARPLGDAATTFAAVTLTGQAMGTPGYMSPEQCSGQKVDHRADLYSLGVMFYEMLTGNVPRGIFPPPSRKVAVDPRFDDVVSRALQSDPADRYQQASEIKRDITHVTLVPAGPPAPDAGTLPPPVPQKRKRRLLLPAAIFLVLCAVGVWSWNEWRTRHAETVSNPGRAVFPKEFDLIPMLDLNRDVRTTGSASGAEPYGSHWQRVGSSLRYDSEGKIGSIRAPLNLIGVKSWEVELDFERTEGQESFHINFPVTATQQFVATLGNPADNRRLIHDKEGPRWPPDKLRKGTVIVRVDLIGNGRDRVRIHLDGRELADWEGDLALRLSFSDEPSHPENPDSRYVSLRIQRDSITFHSWKLRIFDGEAVPTVSPEVEGAQSNSDATLSASQQSPAAAGEEGFISLFNGTDLTGWKASEDAGTTFAVKDGAITGQGGVGHLYYDGPGVPFTDFVLKFEAMSESDANGGLYFHSAWQASGAPNRGIEIQLSSSTLKDFRRTGSIYSLKDVTTSPVADGEWFQGELTVRGKTATLSINGKAFNEWTEPEGFVGKHQFGSGTFALQCLYPQGGVVAYRNLRVKPLPAAK